MGAGVPELVDRLPKGSFRLLSITDRSTNIIAAEAATPPRIAGKIDKRPLKLGIGVPPGGREELE